MLLLVSKLWVPFLALNDRSAVLSFIQVKLVFNENVLVEVAWQILGTHDANQEVNAAIEQIFRSIGKHLFVDVSITILVDRNHINLQLPMVLVIGADQVYRAWVIDQVGQRLETEVTFANDGGLLNVCEGIVIGC